jgi:imidazolonepropionase-like amidohydrolase
LLSRSLFTNGLIFDGRSPDLLADHDVVVEDGVIVEISRAASGPFGSIVDLKGATLMPGLIDAHFHAYAVEVDFLKLESYPPTYLAHRGRYLLERSLRRGFTSVRDVGGADYGLWRAVEEGYIEGPRVFFCGRAFSQTGGHGDVRAPGTGADWGPCGCSPRGTLAEVVDGTDSLRRAAREALRHGAHHLKIFLSGGISSPTDPVWMSQFSEEEISVVVEEAARRRSYVAAHAYGAEAIRRGVTCGVRSIEHGNLIDSDTARMVAAAGAFVVPTLATYDSLEHHGKEAGAPTHLLDKLREVKGKGLEAVEICRAAGVKLGFGTDLLGDLHAYQRDEFRLRAEVETPFQILTSATSVNAELLNMSGRLGCIAVGAFADLLAVSGNPLVSIALLYQESSAVAGIWKGGTRVM